jgi:hypothetical protein
MIPRKRPTDIQFAATPGCSITVNFTANDPDYLKSVRIEMSFVDQMRRINTLAKHIARVVLSPVLAQHN